jgi:hypothetical protein
MRGKELKPVPPCAKPPVDRKEVSAEPMTSTVEALLRLGHEVAVKRSKRATLPALPSAIGRSSRPPKTKE